jgi:ubiquinol-cytochrome c reductase cytochrome c1 subunit
MHPLFKTGMAMLAGGIAAMAEPHPTLAAGDVMHPPAHDWSFAGLFGQFDRAQVQRGLQVYLEVCANCHGLKRIAYRNLAALGYGEEEIKALAAEYEVEDGPDKDGQMFMRPARPSDYFVSPYANTNEAKAMNNGAAPPDLSLITKARHGGADYVAALINGYGLDPGEHEIMEGLNYNPYFPGGQIAMPQPLYGDDVTYADGTEATIAQESADVAAFLTWAAEPELETRKETGLKVILFLIVLTALLYATKRKVWGDVH